MKKTFNTWIILLVPNMTPFWCFFTVKIYNWLLRHTGFSGATIRSTWNCQNMSTKFSWCKQIDSKHLEMALHQVQNLPSWLDTSKCAVINRQTFNFWQMIWFEETNTGVTCRACRESVPKNPISYNLISVPTCSESVPLCPITRCQKPFPFQNQIWNTLQTWARNDKIYTMHHLKIQKL